mgnify:CR=1 FL=1|jgi:hypothetical protein
MSSTYATAEQEKHFVAAREATGAGQTASTRLRAIALMVSAFLCGIALLSSTNDASTITTEINETIEDGLIMRENLKVDLAERESFDLDVKGQQITNSNSKRIALIGNGRGVLKSRKGAEIDREYDIVGRFNFFQIQGFERDVGTRVDMWFLNKLKLPGNAKFRGSTTTGKSKMNMRIKPRDGYFIPVPFEVSQACQKKRGGLSSICVPDKKNVRQIDSEKRVIQRAYARFKITPEFIPELYQRLLHSKYEFLHRFPSTGILVLVYCLERFPNSTVALHGFDFASDQPRIGHYWEKIFKLRTVHSMKLEKQFVLKLIDSGRVRIL